MLLLGDLNPLNYIIPKPHAAIPLAVNGRPLPSAIQLLFHRLQQQPNAKAAKKKNQRSLNAPEIHQINFYSGFRTIQTKLQI